VNLPSLRAVCRIAAIAILLQTGVDLSSAAVCALDGGRLPAVQQGAGGTLVSESGGDAGQPAAPAHVDDCFCCSGCVEVAPATSVCPVTLVSPARGAAAVRHAPLLSRLVFHPPQLLS